MGGKGFARTAINGTVNGEKIIDPERVSGKFLLRMADGHILGGSARDRKMVGITAVQMDPNVKKAGTAYDRADSNMDGDMTKATLEGNDATSARCVILPIIKNLASVKPFRFVTVGKTHGVAGKLHHKHWQFLQGENNDLRR